MPMPTRAFLHKVLSLTAAFALGALVTWGAMRAREPEFDAQGLAGLLGQASAAEYRALSKMLFDDKRLDEAIAAAERGLRYFPGDPVLTSNLGHAQLQSGRIARAERLFADLAARRPDDRAALANLEQARLERAAVEARIAEHIAALSATGAGVDPVPRMRELARDYMKLERDEEALAMFEAILARRPADHAALNEAGMVLLRLGRAQEAQLRFVEALKLQPSDPTYRANVARAVREQSAH